MNTILRKRFDLLKSKFEKQKNDEISISLFNDSEQEFNVRESVDEFLKKKRISRKEIVKFYVKECTGFSESQLEELLFKGKSRQEIRDLKDLIKEAVKYKLLCELEKNLKTDYVYES